MTTKAAKGFLRQKRRPLWLPDPGDGPSEAQLRYLKRGLKQPGGKLPLFDDEGQEIPRRTIESCIAHGWAETWIKNPIKPDWLVARLTDSGYRILGKSPPKKPV